MPKPSNQKPALKVDPDIACQLSVRIPGWFKNQIVEHCETVDVPVSVWVINVLREALRAGKGFPEAPPAKAGLPGLDEQLRLYLLGERLVLPCGRVGVCEGLSAPLLGGVRFCGECGVRVV